MSPRARHPRRPERHPARRERGAAMLIVMVTIAILSALTVDLAYETRVRLQIAANGRDELRAEALAKSAVNLSRLVLGFQQQIDQSMGQASQAMGALLGQLGAGKVPGAAPAAGAGAGSTPSVPRPQIWSLIPVNSGLVGALFGGGAEGLKGADTEEAAAKAATASFGDFEGAFEAKIENEDRKVNVQLDSRPTSGLLGPQVDALLRLMCDARWDGLFDREDETGQRWSRADLPVHLFDWVDDNETASALTVSFPAGNCSAIVPSNPFEPGFSDENFAYDRGRDRYRAKNARFDSLDELHLVAGVTDTFMAAFEDQLTVYVPLEAKINVNATDSKGELLIASLMADPAALPALADPAFAEKLHKALLENPARMGGLMSIGPAEFMQTLLSLGVPVRREIATATGTNSPFTDRSLVFRIRAVGAAGDVTRTIDAVVSYDPRLQGAAGASASQPTTLPQAPSQGQTVAQQVQTVAQQLQASQAQSQTPGGRLVHWRVE